MSVAEDASTPAVAATAGGSVATSLASASFSPPAGSVLVAMCLVNWSTYPGTVPGITVTDSAGGTWTAGPVISLAAAFAKVATFTRPCSTAPGSITVTMSRGTDASAAMLMLAVRVCNGAKVASPQGASITNSGTGTGTQASATLSPQQTGSLVYVAADHSSNNANTALSGTTTIQSTIDTTDAGVLATGVSGTITSTSAQTFGWSTTLGTTDGFVAAALEILPAGSPPPAPPPFPDTPLDVRTELLLGSTWTDVTLWNDHGPVTIGRGHPDESTTASPSELSVTFTNTDGRFTSKNPTGPYYPNLGRNVPLRVSIPSQSTYLRLETDPSSSMSCPDATGLHITGDLDLRVDVKIGHWGAPVLAAKWGSSGTTSWYLTLTTAGKLQLVWSSTGSDQNFLASTLPIPLGRQALRVTLQASTGTVTFYTGPAGGADGSTWTQLGSTVTTGAATSVFSGAAALTAGNFSPTFGGSYGMLGAIYELELRSGIGGTVVAHPVFSAQTAGATSFTDAQGNVWSVNGTAELSGRNYRVHVEVPEWPQHQDESGKTVTVKVAGGGLLRRAGQRNNPIDSPMRRAILALTGTLAPHAYWPCEDLAGATSIGSAVGGPLMTVLGSANMAADSSFQASLPLPTLNNSGWYGVVPSYASSGNIVVRFLLRTSSSGQATLMRVVTTGTFQEFTLWIMTGGNIRITGYYAGGALAFDSGSVAPAVPLSAGVWMSMELTPQGGPGNMTAALTFLAPGGTTAYQITPTVFPGTIGNVTAVYVSPGQFFGSDTTIGHITVQSDWETMFDFQQPLSAWAGELAGDRFFRLCTENGIQPRIIGPQGVTVPMGAQTPQTLVQLLQECADADRGVWMETRQVLGFGYRTQASLCNRAAQVTVDYSQDHLGMWSADPVEDDQTTINDVTLSQTSGGSSVRQYAAPGQPIDGGRLSTLAPPAGVGTYDQAYSANLASAASLSDLAGWILHIGTVDQPRFPGILLDLSNRDLAALFWQILDMDLGDRLVINNPPVWLPPDPVSQLCAHLSETLWAKQLEIIVVGIPESPYEVAVYDDPVLGRADTDGSTLAAGVTAAATSLSVATTGTTKPLWTTLAADFPFDIAIGGERMTVTNITGASSPQTFTVTRSVNGIVKTHSAGDDVRLWFPPILAML